MAEDKISSVIDIPAIQLEFTKVIELATQLATTLKTFPKRAIFTDASNVKDVSNANKELSTSLDQLKVKNDQLTVAIKAQNVVIKEQVSQRKIAAQAAKDQSIAEQESARQAKISSDAKVSAIKAQKQAEEELAIAQSKRKQGSSQLGGISGLTDNPASFVRGNDSESSLLFLAKTKAQLKENQLAQKELGVQLKYNAITQEDYNKKIVAAQIEELEYKKQIQLTNAELKARTNLSSSAQGSIDAARAENALLTKQRNALPTAESGLASPEDIAKLKSLNFEIDKNNDLIRENNDLLGKQKINVGNYPNAFGSSFKTLNTELESVRQKLSSGDFKGEEFDKLTAKMNVLQNATKLTGQTFATTTAQANAHKEAAIQIGQVYGKDSEVFKKYAKEIGEGASQNKDLSKAIDSASSSSSKLAKGFNVAYSGLRKLANLLPSFGISTAILLVFTALQSAAASFVSLFAKVNMTRKAMETLGDVNLKAIDIYNKQSTALSLSTSVINDSALSLKDRGDELERLIAQSPDYLRGLTLENFNTDEGRKILDAYNKSLKEKGELQAAQSVNEDAGKQLATLQVQKEAVEAIIKSGHGNAFQPILDDINNRIKTTTLAQEISLRIYKQKFKENLTSGKDSVKGIIEDLQDQIAKLQKIQPTLISEKSITENVAQIKKLQDEIDRLLGKSKSDRTRRSHEETEKLLDQFRKKDLESLAKYSADSLKIIQDMYKEQYSDQKSSEATRLSGLQKYYDASLQVINNAKGAQYDSLTLEVDTASKGARKIRDSKLRADTLIAIEKYKFDKMVEINQTYSNETTELEKERTKQSMLITTQAFDFMKKEAENAAKFIEDLQKLSLKNQKDKVDIIKDNDLLELEKDFAAGRIKNIEDYNLKKQDIEEKAAIAQKRLDLKSIQDAEVLFESKYGFKNLDLIRQAKDLEVEINSAGNKKILESEKQLADKRKELRNQLEDTLQGIIEGAFDAGQGKDDAKLKFIDVKAQKEIDAINASTLAEEEKQRRILSIQKQADFEKAQIEKRQQARDLARAKFERAASIARVIQNTAEAVTSHLTTPVLIPFDIAIGAAQIALILAQPLPKFAKGTKNAPKGAAVVGELGSELIIDKSGNMSVTPNRPTLVDLAGGETILKHDVTKDILSHMNLMSIIGKAQNAKHPVRVNNNYDEKIYRELRTLNGKPPFIIKVGDKMETTDYYMNNIKR